MTDRKAWHHHDSRHSRHARGYGSAWVKLRARILARDGRLCQECKRQGRVTVATDCDHIIPKAKQGTDDEANLQALCRDCHEAKSRADNGQRPRDRFRPDGSPVW